MVPPLVKTVFYRGFLPLSLLFAAVIRPSLISTGYVLLALICPILPSIHSNAPLPGSVRGFVFLAAGYALLCAIGQLAYQIYEPIERKNEEQYSRICNNTDAKWLRNAGFVRFHGGDGFNSTRSILPEIVSLFASFASLVVISILKHRSEELDVVGSVQAVRDGDTTEIRVATASPNLVAISVACKRVSNVAIIIFCAVVGCVWPSLLNLVYFSAFLFVATWWSLYKPLRHSAYNSIKKSLLFFTAIHILVLYAYQIPFAQEWIPASSLLSRLVGLSPLLQTDCSRWWAFWLTDVGTDQGKLEWTAFANPIVLIIFYHLLVIQLVWTSEGTRSSYLRDDPSGSSVHEEGVLGTFSTLVEDSPSRQRGTTLLLSTDEDPEAAAAEHDEESAPQGAIPLRKVTSQVVDRHKIQQLLKGERAAGAGNVRATDGLVTLFFFCLHHAYALALLTMMTWALLYHSIFGLILLVLTCVLWMFKDTRKAAFALAPIILTYIESLLLIQYICSLDVTDAEFHIKDWMKMTGFQLANGRDMAFVTLAVKLLLSLPVFLLLRLRLREKFYDSLTDHERSQRIQTYGTFSSNSENEARSRAQTEGERGGEEQEEGRQTQSTTSRVFHWFSRQFTLLWIFIVGLILLCVGTQNSPVLYSIGFFAIWTLCIVYLKVSFGFFRRISYFFWLSTIIYTSVVIISLYVYQFPGFPDRWIAWTGIKKEWNDDIGLINYASIGEKGTLLSRLIWPISLFVVTMLQLKFFHEPWSKMVQPVRDGSTIEPLSEEASLTEKCVRWVNDAIELIWRATEVHITKIVFIIVAAFIAENICALYLPLMILISLALCLPSGAANLLSLIMCAYLCLVALFKMVYQLNHIPDFSLSNHGLVECNATRTFPEWLGVQKDADTWHLINGLVIAIIALGAQSVVVYRQRNQRIRNGEPDELKHRIFPGFEMHQFDTGLVNAVKFIIDFGFYKFGYEITLGMMAIDAWVRMDMLGAVVCVWLAFFALNKRNVARNAWPFFVLYLAIILPLQYALYVGLPEDSCMAYPWSHVFGNGADSLIKNRNFDIWAGLSDYQVHWPSSNLLADFFLLMMATCQLAVFRKEKDENDSIYPDEQYYFKAENPHYDFVSQQKSLVDFIKIVIFHYGHWITLITTLVAGIGGTSLFALGYIVLTFWILWQGNNLYVMNAQTNSFKSTLQRWNTLLSYTCFTIFCKVALQLVGCVFLEWFNASNRCPIRQLFSITCVNSIVMRNETIGGGTFNDLFPDADKFMSTCEVRPQEAQIGYDAIALLALVFQLRAFHSWFFQHCMLEYRSEVLLANRGAVLKNQLVEKEMKEQNIQQTEKFDEIRRRTQAIRERYNKQLERGQGAFEPETYGQAKRAGDYYMFDYDPNTDELVQPVESFVPESDPANVNFDKLDPGQLVYAAASKDLDMQRTMKAVEEAEREKAKTSEERMIDVLRDGHGSATAPGRLSTLDADQPSTSDDVPQPMPEPQVSKAMGVFRFVQKIMINGMDMVSVFLNRMSREHRYVAFVLAKEKDRLKDSHSESLSNTSLKLAELRSRMDMPSLHLVHSESDIERMESEVQSQWHERSALARLLNALGNCVAANTDLLCYFLAVLVNAIGGGLITLPLPLMVFLWGTLSNPRPSKFFWVAMIAYTEFVIVVKFICQFQFFVFNRNDFINKNAVNPLSLEKTFGVQRREYFAVVEVPLLFALFFHRYMLRKLGLWKDANLTVTFNESQLEDGLTMDTIAHSRANSTEDGAVEATNDDTVRTEGGEDGAAAVTKKTEAPKNPIVRFIEQLFKPKFRYIRDLYPIMFGLDVVAFLTISFGYSGFGEGGSGNVIGDIQKSRIPLTLVVMLIVMTLMIVIDRGLYLRKWVYGKLAYQLIIIVFIHIWIFFVLPEITRKSAVENHVAQFLYIVKCLYLLVSAWQIRNGYPQLCIGNLLTHAYGLANMIFFKVFMAVPFLFELRTAIDWTWTDTSMPLFDFFNMENFYSVIYNLKCARTFEGNYPAPRGQPKGVIVKYFMGLPMILAIVLLVWSPLLAFSLLNQIGDVSIPNRVKLSMSLEGYPPLYQIEAQGDELQHFEDNQRNQLINVLANRFSVSDPESIKRSRNSVAFLKDYSDTDVMIVKFRPESEIVWPISAESLQALKSQLATNSSISFQLSVEFSRPYDAKKKVSEKHSTQWNLQLSNDSNFRKKIISALDGNGTLVLDQTFPSYMLVPNEGEVVVPDPLVESIIKDNIPPSNDTSKTSWFDSLSLTIEQSSTGPKVWVAQSTHPSRYNGVVFFNASSVPYSTSSPRNYLQTVAFVDKAYPSFFAKYLQGGVITMYVTVVIVVGRLIRGLFTNSPTDVMISEIPNPDYLLKICLDIYLVREAKDFYLEQDLFAKLIFLFRSPATLIQWTRYKVKND